MRSSGIHSNVCLTVQDVSTQVLEIYTFETIESSMKSSRIINEVFNNHQWNHQESSVRFSRIVYEILKNHQWDPQEASMRFSITHPWKFSLIICKISTVPDLNAFQTFQHKQLTAWSQTFTEQWVDLSGKRLSDNWYCCSNHDDSVGTRHRFHWQFFHHISYLMAITFCSLSGKLWYLQHNCVGDTIVYH